MPTTAQLAADKSVNIDEVVVDDDTYFELELTRTKYDAKPAVQIHPAQNNVDDEDFRRNVIESVINCSMQRALTNSSSSSSSSDDGGSLHRETNTFQYSGEKLLLLPPRQQSPISILPSSPTLQSLMFPSKWTMKEKSLKTRTTDVVDLAHSARGLLHRPQQVGRLFSLRSRVDDASKFRRSNSSRSTCSRISTCSSSSSSSSSKRFSNLNLFRSLFSKLSWIIGVDAEDVDGAEGFVCSPGLSFSSSFRSSASKSWMWSSPVSGGGGGMERKCQLGGLRSKSRFGRLWEKSPSASSVTGVGGGSRRDDDSMDGIEGAILHCKQSLKVCTCTV